MTTVKEQEGLYLSSFTRLESALNENAPAWLSKLRRAAIGSFAELGFPTTHDEEWLYTNVSALASTPFVPARVKLTEELRQKIERLPLADLGCSRLTFLNGCYVPETLEIAGGSPGTEGRQPGLRLEKPRRAAGAAFGALREGDDPCLRRAQHRIF